MSSENETNTLMDTPAAAQKIEAVDQDEAVDEKPKGAKLVSKIWKMTIHQTLDDLPWSAWGSVCHVRASP